MFQYQRKQLGINEQILFFLKAQSLMKLAQYSLLNGTKSSKSSLKQLILLIIRTIKGLYISVLSQSQLILSIAMFINYFEIHLIILLY